MKTILCVLLLSCVSFSAYAETNQNWDEDGLWAGDREDNDWWPNQPPFNPGSSGSGGCGWFDRVVCYLGCSMLSIGDVIAGDGEEVGGDPCMDDCYSGC